VLFETRENDENVTFSFFILTEVEGEEGAMKEN
jgi:hypothetical protein